MNYSPRCKNGKPFFNQTCKEVQAMKNGRGFSIVWALVGILLLVNPVWGAAGDQLWATSFDFFYYPAIDIYDMAVSQNKVIVCGRARPPGGDPLHPGPIGFVKALDVVTGNIKWEKTLTLGSEYNGFSSITLYGNVAIVAGIAFYVSDPPYSISVLQAYDADTGQLLWENKNDFFAWAASASSQLNPQLKPLVALGNNRVFLAGVIYPEPYTTTDCIVRAFQVKNATIPLSLLLE
jgi:outer membrane protein assembly factor BamB